MDLKRDIVKYIRDKAKNQYEKAEECYICGKNITLDFHHYYTLSPLVHDYVKKNNLLPKNVLSFREDFIEAHRAELYDHTVTLCHEHHLHLHSIYGRNPTLGTAKKQERWVEIQREKHGMV
jgi:hypothetical protein|tara:strand:+ start:111 stop:473 length:363 start_codon:yes stop_codon:yes gene_type:complete